MAYGRRSSKRRFGRRPSSRRRVGRMMGPLRGQPFAPEKRSRQLAKVADVVPMSSNAIGTPADIAIGTTPIFNCLNMITIGAAEYNRIGRKISLSSLQIRFGLRATNASTTNRATESVRALLVYDRQPNGAAPLYSDILLDQRANGATQTDPYSFPNIDNTMRFKILKDWIWELPNFAAGASGDCEVFSISTGKFGMCFTKTIKLRGLETIYKADTATPGLADIAVGSLWFLVFSDVATASTQTSIANTDCRFRLRFYDR